MPTKRYSTEQIVSKLRQAVVVVPDPTDFISFLGSHLYPPA